MSDFKDAWMSDEEEIFCSHSSDSKEDDESMRMISVLETILFDEKFQNLLDSFYDENCDIFEDSHENKIQYTETFNKYTKTIEDIIEKQMKESIPGFKLSQLEKFMSAKQDELGGEVFDVLYSLSSFEDFKEQMVAQKKIKQQSNKSLDLQMSGRKL